MEENRLKPMPENYDQKLFNELFSKTEQLRKKLAWQIDARRFGVDYKEVLSWFSVKFIQVFTKYYDKKPPELLKAYLIQSLMMFKNRILRSSLSQKSQLHQTVDIEDTYNLTTEEDLDPDRQILMDLSLSFLKEKLTPDAYKVLQIELNPPLFILETLADKEKASTTKIPSRLIAEYLGWNDNKSLKKIGVCREEIKECIDRAKEFFHEHERLV